jgi:prephenate dehydrogenase
MLEVAYPDPTNLHQLRVHVPDRPGVLAALTPALGAERINIEDFELQHLSRERGGTLTLLVGGEDEAVRAAKILEAQGYNAVISAVLE